MIIADDSLMHSSLGGLNHYLYWIRRVSDKDVSKFGYVGVSKNVTKRLAYHNNYLLNGNKGGRYMDSFYKIFNEEDLVISVIDCGTEKEMLYKESLIRPNKNIGWNIAVGGLNVRSSDVYSILGELVSDRDLSQALGFGRTLIQNRKRKMPYYCKDILASKSDKFEDRVNKDFCQVNGIDYYYSDLSPTFVSGVVSMYLEGLSSLSISEYFKCDRDRVYRVLKMLGYETKNKLTFCFRGVWIETFAKDATPFTCYCALDMYFKCGSIRDVCTVYSIDDQSLRKWVNKVKEETKLLGV